MSEPFLSFVHKGKILLGNVFLKILSNMAGSFFINYLKCNNSGKIDYKKQSSIVTKMEDY